MVNYNISLTWIVRPFGDDFPNIHHDSRVRENSEVVIISPDLCAIYPVSSGEIPGIAGPTLAADTLHQHGWVGTGRPHLESLHITFRATRRPAPEK